jgi:hypothetical protein
MSDTAWPKGCRKVTRITAVNHDNGLIYLTMERLNRGTGYVDFTELGAMTPADFKATAQSMED